MTARKIGLNAVHSPPHRSRYRVFEEWQYLQRRCDEERTKAGFCADELMADVHREFARLYRARAERLVNAGPQTMVVPMSGVGEEIAQLDR